MIRPDQVATVVVTVLIGGTVVTYSSAWSPIASYATTLNHIDATATVNDKAIIDKTSSNDPFTLI